MFTHVCLNLLKPVEDVWEFILGFWVLTFIDILLSLKKLESFYISFHDQVKG
jgi:hypothetical protein